MDRNELLLLISFFVDNNNTKINDILKNNGYSPSNEKENIFLLEKIFIENPDKFISIIKEIPFNRNTNNYTTDKDFIEKLSKSLNNNSEVSREDVGSIFDKIIGYISGKTVSTKTTQKQSSNIVVMVVLILIVLMFAGFVTYRLTK